MSLKFSFFACVLALTGFSTASALPKNDEAIIEGKVSFGSDCKGDTAEVFLSHKDKTLIYQVSVPRDGTFRFNVVPNKYDVSVKSADCFYKVESKQITKGQKDFVAIDLKSKERNPAMSEAAPAGVCNPPPCRGPVYGPGTGIPNYLSNYSFPYWGYYGSLYPNFYYPGAWGNSGLNQFYYPGGANIAMAKPVVYIDAPEKSAYDVSIAFKDPQSNWLMTVPSYESKWSVQVGKSSELFVDKTRYSYLFYDYRAEDAKLQNTSGFCATRKEALEKMEEILKASGFKKPEIEDFETHWSIKLPPTDHLCVFPQTEKQLNTMNEIIVKPEIAKMKRVLFVVMTKDKGKFYGAGKFQEEPQVAWKTDSNVPGTRQPSSKETVLREWGVAFHFVESQR